MARTKPVAEWLNRAKQVAMKEWTREFNHHRNAIYLTDPKADKAIRRIIKAEVVPAALGAMRGSRLRIYGGREARIEREWQVNACYSVHILVEDPLRPMEPGKRPPWYARLTVQCQVTGIGMLSDFLSVTLPLNTPFEFLIDIMSETSRGLPTRMSVEEDRTGERTLSIEFEHGGSGTRNDLASPADRIRSKLLAYCDFAEAAYELEEDPTESLSFRKLIREVNNVFEI